MVIFGQFYTSDLIQQWFLKEILPKAREVLSKFNTLDEWFSSFKGYENKEYKQANNIVFRMCMPLKGDISLNIIKRLSELEETLSMFNVRSWPREKLNSLRNRLCSDDYYQSLSAYSELVIAKRLADKFGKDKVEIYPRLSTGKFSDILVKLETKNVYLEVGNLGESLPEKKIQEIVDEAAKYLGEKLKNPCYFRVTIDTAELVFDQNGYIDVKESIRKIISEIDRLCLYKLAGFEGSIKLRDIAFVLSKVELLKKVNLIDHTTKKYLKLIEKPHVKQWVNSCREQIVQGSKLICSIKCYKLGAILVEVHTNFFYPSSAAEAELNSIINHVVRHIKGQLEEEQLQPNSPNIIVIQSGKLDIFYLMFGFPPINQLYKKIKKFFHNRREKNLSGIILFSTDFDKLIFIANDQAGKKSKLTKNEVEKLGAFFI